MKGNLNHMNFETKRLILRAYEQDDFEDIHAYASNIENIRFNLWGPNTPQDTKAFIEDVLEKAAHDPRIHYDFIIVLKETNRVIGATGLYLNNSYEGHLGYILNKEYWQNGYAHEAATKLLEFGFLTLKLHRIYATCYAENYGSYRVMEKLGMRHEGTFLKKRKGTRPFDAPWYDEKIYAILDEEYEKGK